MPKRADGLGLLQDKVLVPVGIALSGLVLALSVAGVWMLASPAHEPPAQTQVLVATSAISTGDAILPQAVRQESLPRDRVPPDAVSGFEEVAGMVARRPIAPGEVLTKDALQRPAVVDVAGSVEEGMRAVTVVVPQRDAVMGRLLPGDRVDVLGTFTRPFPVTRVLVRGARVIRVDRVKGEEPGAQGNGSVAVTLEVPVPSVPRIVLAQHSGRVTLVARSSRDPQVETKEGGPMAGLPDLLREPRQVPQPAPRSSSAPSPATLVPLQPPPPLPPAVTPPPRRIMSPPSAGSRPRPPRAKEPDPAPRGGEPQFIEGSAFKDGDFAARSSAGRK
ncbi:MAG: Flp pilus assembly protein CpaB [Armatimonadota bacterium]|nr:Flp pilus assembly protein CpaB [Armatimonadota bacterium]MDR7562473.1 Flp pilus assembly protein CpaB [Armatimonadota bacterium]MDR7566829.1 Flp pilus assembly protein CpaB [Armatimonadota bacterium]